VSLSKADRAKQIAAGIGVKSLFPIEPTGSVVPTDHIGFWGLSEFSLATADGPSWRQHMIVPMAAKPGRMAVVLPQARR